MTDDLVFSEKEINLIKNNMDLIPDNIFDIHNHVYLKGNIQEELQNVLFYNEFSFDDLSKIKKILYLGKCVESVVFGQPQIDSQSIKNNNDYIKLYQDNKFLLLPNDTAYIESELLTLKWKGAKVYGFNEKGILSNISDETLSILDEKNMPLIIHLPCNIIEDLKELCDLLKRYRNIMFIIAHGGNIQKCKRDYEGYLKALESLRSFDNIGFDTSCINDAKYLRMLVNNFDIERIFYGSDFPISLIRGITLPGKNGSARIVSDKLIRGIDNNLSRNIIKNLKLDLSNVVNIQQTTISVLGDILGWSHLEKVFYKNARSLNVFS